MLAREGDSPLMDTPGGCAIFGKRSQARRMQAMHGGGRVMTVGGFG